MSLRNTTLLTTAAVLALMTGTSDAAVIAPDSATSSTSVNSGRVIGRTIDGVGLSGGGLSGDILSETHKNNDVNSNDYWLSGNYSGTGVSTEVLVFSFNTAVDIDGIHLWTYDRLGNKTRSIKNFDMEFTTAGGTTTILKAALGDFTTPTADPIPVQSKSFSTVSGVTAITITNIENFGDSSYVGLSEIRFNQVPEPGSLALLGLGGLCMLKRRRR